MKGQQDLPTVILTVVIVFCILAIGTFAINSASQATGGGASTETVDQTALLDGTDTVTLGDRVGEDETVYNSLGYAANFSGASDSYMETTGSPDFGTVGNWSVSTWARVDSDATARNMTVTAVSGDVTIQYNGTRGNWTAYYYDRSSRQTWRVDVNAPDANGNFSLITATANETHLTIWRNTTRGETVDITGSNSANYGTYGNFDGRVDETRLYNESTNATEQAALVASPVAPTKDRARTGRVMYDEPDRETQRLFFATGDLETSNATFSQGLPGEELEGKSFVNDVTGTTDYQWDIVGPKIRPVAGGQLDGAPAAYVTYDAQGNLNTLADDWNQVMGLAAVLIVLLPLGAIIGYFKLIQPGR